MVKSRSTSPRIHGFYVFFCCACNTRDSLADLHLIVWATIAPSYRAFNALLLALSIKRAFHGKSNIPV